MLSGQNSCTVTVSTLDDSATGISSERAASNSYTAKVEMHLSETQ